MEFKNLSDWIMIEHCATRIVAGGDPNKVSDRVAFIEKTPRVRLSENKYAVEIKEAGNTFCSGANGDAWIYGPKGSSEYGHDERSRKWCDQMLQLTGWY